MLCKKIHNVFWIFKVTKLNYANIFLFLKSATVTKVKKKKHGIYLKSIQIRNDESGLWKVWEKNTLNLKEYSEKRTLTSKFNNRNFGQNFG